MLTWNQRKVRQLTPSEIWLFIAGRVLAGFGLGALAVGYFPRLSTYLGWPPLLVGALCLVVAAKGFARPEARPEEPPPSVGERAVEADAARHA
ncbi:MAG TPA: hypothetical protein VF771_08020 [Longimicrobiaceae bacterium]